MTASPLPSPSASPTPSPSPTRSPTPAARPPTDADRARFVNAHRPDGATDIHHVAVDVDGDEVDELVFAMVREERLRVEIAWWDGTGHAILAVADGATANRIAGIGVSDVNADDLIEVAVRHAGEDRAGLDLWAVVDRDLEEVDGKGGCVEGNSFGERGARLVDVDADGLVEIVGTCDGPISFFRETVTWRWDGKSYRSERGNGREDG